MLLIGTRYVATESVVGIIPLPHQPSIHQWERGSALTTAVASFCVHVMVGCEYLTMVVTRVHPPPRQPRLLVACCDDSDKAVMVNTKKTVSPLAGPTG